MCNVLTMKRGQGRRNFVQFDKTSAASISFHRKIRRNTLRNGQRKNEADAKFSQERFWFGFYHNGVKMKAAQKFNASIKEMWRVDQFGETSAKKERAKCCKYMDVHSGLPATFVDDPFREMIQTRFELVQIA